MAGIATGSSGLAGILDIMRMGFTAIRGRVFTVRLAAVPAAAGSMAAVDQAAGLVVDSKVVAAAAGSTAAALAAEAGSRRISSTWSDAGRPVSSVRDASTRQ